MKFYIALLCVLFVFWLFWRWKKLSHWKNLGIPGPTPNLIFGNILEIFNKGHVKCHEEWMKRYGRVLGYFYGMRPMLLVSDPYLIKKIFIEDFNKFTDREPLDPLCVYDRRDKNLQTITNLEGKEWKDVRKILMPIFNTSNLKLMSVKLKSSIEVMLKILQKNAQKRISINMPNVYQRLVVDFLTRTMFDIQTDVQQDIDSNILRAMKLIFRIPYRDIRVIIGMSFPLLTKFCFQLQIMEFSIRNKFQSPHGALRKIIQKEIKMRRKDPEIKKNDLIQLLLDSFATEDADNWKLKTKNDALEYEDIEEIRDKKTKRLKDYEIENNALTFLLAGFETTSASLCFLTYLLGKHQDEQEKVYQEIKKTLEREHELEFANINNLSYLDKFICEGLRMYGPVISFNLRYSVEDVHYEDLYIPKGTLVQAPAYLMHHNPEFWSEPEKFCPERFNTKPNSEGITYLPFGIGPRNCIGMRFALLEIKLALASIVSKFNIKLDGENKNNFNVWFSTRGMIPTEVIVKLEPRKEDC